MTELWTPAERVKSRPKPGQGAVPDDDPRWEALRAPFPQSQIGHKPQPWCRACSDARTKHCDNHRIIKCNVCRQRITEAHIDLDFVGHAAVTQRLLEVDPHWDWWPMTAQEVADGNFPAAGPNGMWIWLWVLDKVRPGIGEVEGTQLKGGNATKALVSDAIKNASMRFGVAIETWSKEDLSEKAEAAAEAAGTVAQGVADEPEKVPDGREWARELGQAATMDELNKLAAECKSAGQFSGANSAAARTRSKYLNDQAKKANATAAEPAGDQS